MSILNKEKYHKVIPYPQLAAAYSLIPSFNSNVKFLNTTKAFGNVHDYCARQAHIDNLGKLKVNNLIGRLYLLKEYF